MLGIPGIVDSIRVVDSIVKHKTISIRTQVVYLKLKSYFLKIHTRKRMSNSLFFPRVGFTFFLIQVVYLQRLYPIR